MSCIGDDIIRIDKPANGGIIIPALQIVESSFLIIDTRMSSTRQKFLAYA